MEYQFTVLCELPERDFDIEMVLARLLSANCTEAVALPESPGHLSLSFTREGYSPDYALSGAITDLKRAFPEAAFDSAQLLGQLLLFRT